MCTQRNQFTFFCRNNISLFYVSEFITEQKKKLKNTSTEKERIEQELQTLHKEKIELEEKIKLNKSLCEEKVISDTDDDDLSDLVKKVSTLKEGIIQVYDINEQGLSSN